MSRIRFSGRMVCAGGILAIALAGCTGDKNGAPQAEPSGTPSAPEAIKRRPVASLPAVGEYLPPLDDGRIEVAPPADWKPLPRDSRFLVRFYKTQRTGFPRIDVTAEAPPAGATSDTTEANADTLAAQFLQQLQQREKEDKTNVLEPPKPIILGDHTFVRHVRTAGSSGDSVLTIVCLQTVHSQRLYTIELILDPGKEHYSKVVKPDQESAYAIAANLKFPSGGAKPAETSDDEK